MNEKLAQIYNMEKEFLESKRNLQNQITSEIRLMQGHKSYELSLEALNKSDKTIYIPYGKAFLRR
jgi:hypothetical protein